MPARDRCEVLLAQFVPTVAQPSGAGVERILQATLCPRPCSAAPQRPVVVGGIVMDLLASPSGADVKMGTSVPGVVKHVPGGVGRNIAEGVARLVTEARKPAMVSMVGADSAGEYLLAQLRAHRISTQAIAVVEGVASPSVVTVFDRRGEVAACVADVTAMERYLTPERVQQHARLLQGASMVVLDANLSPDTLACAARLAAEARVPALGEPVSVPKSVRLVGCLQHLHYITPNVGELVAMAAAARRLHALSPLPLPAPSSSCLSPGEALQDVRLHLSALLQEGVEAVVLTMGHQGAALVRLAAGSRRGGGSVTLEALHIPALPCSVVSLSGAGDCLVAGMVAALLEGQPAEYALACGVAAASCSAESRSNVPEELHMGRLHELAAGLLRCAQLHSIACTTLATSGPGETG